jgi:hypothetical protein
VSYGDFGFWRCQRCARAVAGEDALIGKARFCRLNGRCRWRTTHQIKALDAVLRLRLASGMAARSGYAWAFDRCGPCRIMTQAPGLVLVPLAAREVAASVRTLR